MRSCFKLVFQVGPERTSRSSFSGLIDRVAINGNRRNSGGDSPGFWSRIGSASILVQNFGSYRLRPFRGRFIYFFNATLPGYMCQASLPKTSPFHQAVPAPPYSNVCEDPSHKISRGCPWFCPPASFLCALDGPLNSQWNGGYSDGL